jgi:hypothetical protein
MSDAASKFTDFFRHRKKRPAAANFERSAEERAARRINVVYLADVEKSCQFRQPLSAVISACAELPARPSSASGASLFRSNAHCALQVSRISHVMRTGRSAAPAWHTRCLWQWAEHVTGGRTIYHTVEFPLKGLAELETKGKPQLERLLIQQGTRLNAEIKPYVVETERGPVEVADLFLEDGSVARAVRYATFIFVDESPELTLKEELSPGG